MCLVHVTVQKWARLGFTDDADLTASCGSPNEFEIMRTELRHKLYPPEKPA